MTDSSLAAASMASRFQRETDPRVPESSVPAESSVSTTPLPTAAVNPPIIEVTDLEKTYRTARGPLTLFKHLDFTVPSGEMVAIVGQSGAGKSTLLHILGALDAPSAGTVYCASTNVASLTPRQAATFRNREIGYVWQFHYLLPEFTAQENVAMPLMAGGQSKREALVIALNWLREVGLEDRRDHRPGELSGGEQQRVALARALVNKPRLLLADEPTGDLDAATANQVFALLQRIHADYGLTSIVVTHNMDLAGRCSRLMRLDAGRLTAVTTTTSTIDEQIGPGKSSVPGAK